MGNLWAKVKRGPRSVEATLAWPGLKWFLPFHLCTSPHSFTPRILESNAVTTKGEKEGVATEELVVPPAAEGEKVQSGINLFNRWSYDEIQNHRELGGDGVAAHYGAARFGYSGQRRWVFHPWWFDGQLTAKVQVRRWKQCLEAYS